MPAYSPSSAGDMVIQNNLFSLFFSSQDKDKDRNEGGRERKGEMRGRVCVLRVEVEVGVEVINYSLLSSLHSASLHFLFTSVQCSMWDVRCSMFDVRCSLCF